MPRAARARAKSGSASRAAWKFSRMSAPKPRRERTPRSYASTAAREAVEGRGHEPIVLGEGPRAKGGGQVEEPVIEALLLPELGLERPQKARRVHGAVQPAVEHAGARGEVEGRRDGRRGPHLGRGAFALLTQPVQEHVAAEGDAGGPDPEGGLADGQGAHDPVEILGFARVVHARGQVDLSTARAEVEGHGAPAPLLRLAHEATDVVRLARALEAVKDDDEGSAPLARGQPVEVDEVAVRRAHALPPELGELGPTEERAPEGLKVRPPEPPRRVVVGGRGLHLGRPGLGALRRGYSWPWRSSFTISGAISLARCSSCASVRFAMGCGRARNL